MKVHCVALVAFVSIGLFTRGASAAAAPPEKGLWVEGRLVEIAPAAGTGMRVFGVRLPAGVTPEVSPFAIGYKLDRLLVGAGLNLTRMTTGDEVQGGVDREITTLFWINPGVSFAILESGDRAANLYARGGLHLSFGSLDDKPVNGGGTDEDIFGWGGDAALGLRAYLTSYAAIGAELGMAYASVDVDPEGRNNNESNSAFAFFGGLTLIGVLPL